LDNLDELLRQAAARKGQQWDETTVA